MDVVSYEYGTLAIEVCFFFYFAVVFSSTYFRFCQVQTNYSAISVSLGDASRTGTSIYNGTILIAHRTRKKKSAKLNDTVKCPREGGV
jgi:hypothetical protein